MRDRSYRRWRREVAINHAFHVRHSIWGNQNEWQKYHWVDREKVVGANKWECQDENRSHYRKIATVVADYLKTCSCAMCRDYWPKGQTPRELRLLSEMNVDSEDLKEYLYGVSSLD